jgi:hypothetical protein
MNPFFFSGLLLADCVYDQSDVPPLLQVGVDEVWKNIMLFRLV